GCSVFPYMPLFLSKVLLINEEQIGFLLSITPFVEFFSAGIWTFLADKFCAHKSILLTCISFATCTTISYPLTGKVIGFEGLLLSFLFCALFNGGIAPLIDNFTIATLKKDGKQVEYGRQLIYCMPSVSAFGELCLVVYLLRFQMGAFAGLIISTSTNNFNYYQKINQNIPLNNDDDLELDLFVKDNIIDNDTNTEADLGTENSTKKSITILNSTSILLQLLENPKFLFFLFITLLIAIVKSVCGIYLFLYLSETFHASGTLMGLCNFMGISLEIICFNYAKEFLKLLGPRNMIIVGQLALIIRVGLYGFLEKKMKSWMALPIELLQGVMYALIWTAGVEITSNFAPNSLQATYLGIYYGIFQLSSGIGAIIGAVIFSRSPTLMFQIMTALAIFALILYIMGEMFIFKYNKYKYSMLDNDQSRIGQEELR
ncbi:3210_t:CDS:2, partial [Funneliformis caledonium]